MPIFNKAAIQEKMSDFNEICKIQTARATLFGFKFGSLDGSIFGSKSSNDAISKVHFKVAI